MTTTAATAAAAQGLSSVPQLAGGVTTPQASPPALRFPGTELVEAAAALFRNPPRLLAAPVLLVHAGAGYDAEGRPVDRHRIVGGDLIGEGRRFRVTVSAGTVGLSCADPARYERNKRNALGHDPQVRAAIIESGEGFVYDDEGPVFQDPRPGRQVEGWSRKSRARMVRTLAQLDWSPMYAEGRPAVMLTLTYPGDWLTVARSGRVVKQHLDVLRKRWQRAWGAPMVGPWKLEFQRRGAPHVHFMVVPPKGTAGCRCRDCACWCLLEDCGTVCGQLRFADWLSHTWADVVAHPNLEERRRHRLAGTGVDYLKGGRVFDPKRAAVYFSKHGGAAGGKEYQHNVPQEWQGQGEGPGRFWGYWQLQKVTADADLDLADYVRVRRTMRRWSEAQGLTRTRRVPRGFSTVTGEQLYRTVRRPVRYLGAGGLLGGTVLVNDGPAFASVLSRLTES